MDSWFCNLGAQLSASAPAPEMSALPEQSQVKIWAKALAKDALKDVEADLETSGSLAHTTALNVSRCLSPCPIVVDDLLLCRHHNAFMLALL